LLVSGWVVLSLRTAVGHSDSGKNEEFQLLSHAEVAVSCLWQLVLHNVEDYVALFKSEGLVALDHPRPDACGSSHAGGQVSVHHRM